MVDKHLELGIPQPVVGSPQALGAGSPQAPGADSPLAADSLPEGDNPPEVGRAPGEGNHPVGGNPAGLLAADTVQKTNCNYNKNSNLITCKSIN